MCGSGRDWVPAPGEENGLGAWERCQTGSSRQQGVWAEGLCCAMGGGFASANDVPGMLQVGLQQAPGQEGWAVPFMCEVLCEGPMPATSELKTAVGLALPVSSVRLSQTGAQLWCWLKMNSEKWQPGLPLGHNHTSWHHSGPHWAGGTWAGTAGGAEKKYKEKVSNDSVQNSWHYAWSEFPGSSSKLIMMILTY